MKRLVLMMGSAGVLFACATAKPKETMPAEEAFAPPPKAAPVAADPRATLGTPKEWALQYRRDLDCEQAARDLIPVYGREAGWTYVKACVTKGGFTQLKTLCTYWTDELKTRPEAGSIIAEVIGARGAHLLTDLALVQEQRIPLFDLASALKQPSAFKGRYLVVLGKVGDLKERGGRTEVTLQEQARSSEVSRVVGKDAYGTVSNSSSKGSVSWQSRDSIVGSGSASGSSSSQRSSVSGKMEQRVTDTFDETGQVIIAKLKQPDPFLRAEQNMVFLVRFDGTAVADAETTNEGEEPKRTALVTLVSYHGL